MSARNSTLIFADIFLFWGLIFPAWSVIINMEKELNTDTQTALLELRDFSVMKGVFFYASL